MLRLNYFARFGDYEVYDDGRVYSNITHRYLIPDIVQGYEQVTLFINGTAHRIKVHRLVAMCFIDNPDNLPVVNHINGKKRDNRVENLEWCTYKHNNEHARRNNLNNVSKSNHDRWLDPDFRERTRKKFSEVHRLNKTSAGENNPRFRYRIYHGNCIIGRTELAEVIGRSQSNTDSLIKRAANGEYIKVFDQHGVRVMKVK